MTPLVLLLELLGDRVEAPDFEKILEELDWRAIFFYIALFALVGGLEKMKIIDHLADFLRPIFVENLALGATLLYWMTVPIASASSKAGMTTLTVDGSATSAKSYHGVN